MNDDQPRRSPYRVISRLLARKGNAEPLPTTGKPLVLATENHRIPTDDEHLVEAVTDATLEILNEPSRLRRSPRAAAPLTDLFDPALSQAFHRGAKDMDG